jgi:hypothetical protein
MMRSGLVKMAAAACWLCLLGGAWAAAGEGTGVLTPKYTSPKATFNTMWEAAKAANKDAMLACFSDVCRKKLAEIEKLMAELPKEMREKGNADFSKEVFDKAKTAKVVIGDEKIDGDKATLDVTTDEKKETLQFVKADGAWKMHVPELASLDIEQMKAAVEMIKNMAKQAAEKGAKEAPEKGAKEAPEKAKE